MKTKQAPVLVMPATKALTLDIMRLQKKCASHKVGGNKS